MPKRISGRVLNFAEARRQQAQDDWIAENWDNAHPEYETYDNDDVDDGGWWRTPGLMELEDAYWDLIQWGFAKDRQGREYDRYADVPSNHGPDREYDERRYDLDEDDHWSDFDDRRFDYGYDYDKWDDDTDDRPYVDDGDPLGLGDAYDWQDAYWKYLYYAYDTEQSYRAWIARASSSDPVDEDTVSVIRDETIRSSNRNMTKGLVPDIKREEQLRMFRRRVSLSWKDVAPVDKRWMKKAS